MQKLMGSSSEPSGLRHALKSASYAARSVGKGSSPLRDVRSRSKSKEGVMSSGHGSEGLLPTTKTKKGSPTKRRVATHSPDNRSDGSDEHFDERTIRKSMKHYTTYSKQLYKSIDQVSPLKRPCSAYNSTM